MKKSIISLLLALLLALNVTAVYADSLPATDEELVQLASIKLNFSDLSSDEMFCVENDITLPAKFVEGDSVVYIDWRSSNPSLLKIVSDGDNYKGIVNIPYFGEGYQGVKLTATFYRGTAFSVKNFYLIMKEGNFDLPYSDKMIALRDKFRDEFLMYNSLYNLKTNLYIPTVEGASVRFVSEYPDVIEETISEDNTLKVHRRDDSDVDVNLNVVFETGNEMSQITFPLVVKAMTMEELKDIPRLDIENEFARIKKSVSLTSVVSDMSLKKAGSRGSIITWSSSNTDAVTAEGVITRGNSDERAVLTACATYKGYTYEDSFEVVVKAKYQDNTVISSGGSGSAYRPENNKNEDKDDEPITPKPDTTSHFKDVKSDFWAYDYIIALVNEGVVSGYSDNTFRPNSDVSREEFVKMLLLATDTYEEGFNSNFGDVPNDSWYYTYVSCAYDKGIVQGINEKYFGSGVKLSRQDAAVMICRALGIESKAIDESAFPDFAQISDYARSAVSTLYERGIVSGDEKGYFNPKNNITRAEVSKILDLIR